MLSMKKVNAMLAFAVLANGLTAPSLALTTSNPILGSDVCATVTAHKGVVFKRDYVDFTRQTFGDPVSVKDQDKLHEGMQIGTGNDSWAEVQWPSVRTRAWANTVFEVAPNKRLVYLAGGEMLFRLDKHRPDKNQPYYIWTKVLQARIRGTTVLVQAKANTTRFTVIEGVVDIWNRLDHSHVTLNPGVVYEVKGFDLSKQVPLPDLKSSKATAEPQKISGADGKEVAPYKSNTGTNGNEDKSVHDVTYETKSYMPLFQDKYEQTNVYASNSQALENHPLVVGGGGLDKIDSMDLIHAAQKDLPGVNPLVPLKTVESARLERVVYKNMIVKGVPTNADWYVGKSFSSKIEQISFVDLQPKGVVFNPTQQTAQITAQVGHIPGPAPVAAFTGVGIPILPPFTGKKINLDEDAPAPVQEYAQAASQAQPPNTRAVHDSSIPTGLQSTNVVAPGATATTTNSANNAAASTAANAANAALSRPLNPSVFNAVSVGAGSAGTAAAVQTTNSASVVQSSSTNNGATTQVFSGASGNTAGLLHQFNGLNNSVNNSINNLSGTKLH